MVLDAWPNKGDCTRIISMENQSFGNTTPCSGSTHTWVTVKSLGGPQVESWPRLARKIHRMDSFHLILWDGQLLKLLLCIDYNLCTGVTTAGLMSHCHGLLLSPGKQGPVGEGHRCSKGWSCMVRLGQGCTPIPGKLDSLSCGGSREWSLLL
jgi:hypothetical protein